MSGPTAIDRAWQLAYGVAGPFLRLSWRVWPRAHRGALVAITVDDRILLLRSSYRAGWGFPGGGIERGETPLAAARRELREEIGLVVELAGEPTIIDGRWEGRPDRVHLFTLRLDREPALRLDHREIVEARWVSPRELAGMRLTGPVGAYLKMTGALAR